MSTVDPHGPTAAPAGAGFRERFRGWRAQRPFWGCLITIIGGVWIYGGTLAPLGVIQSQGTAGILSLSVFLLTVILGGTTLFQPHLRSLTGLIVVVMGPLSILAVNLGGFVIGMVLLVIGGGMMFAWTPAEEEYDPDYVSGAPVVATSTLGGRHRDPNATEVLAEGEPPQPPGPRIDLRERRAGGALSMPPAPSRPSRPAGSAEPAAPRRGGLANVLDTMFGSRMSGAMLGGSKESEASKESKASKDQPVARNAPKPGQRPAKGQRPRPGQPRPAGSGQRRPGQPGQRRRPPGDRPGTPPEGRRPLRPPSDPPPAEARTWLVVSLLLVALVVPGALAPSATAAEAKDPGWFDWLFPPKTPAPSTTKTPAAKPSPSPSDTGFVLPELGKVQIGAPKPPAGTPKETTATCPPQQDQKGGATVPGTQANDAVELIRGCLGAGEEAIGLVSGNAPPPPKGTPKLVSDDVLTLKATKLAMKGLAYGGLNTLQTKNGPKKVMHFTADSVTVDNLNQSNPFGGGTNSLKALQGSQAILSGNVNLYVDSMDAKIFGLLPLKFDPKFQPPLVFQNMFFTDALTVVSLVSCDKILVPDTEIRIGSAAK